MAAGDRHSLDEFAEGALAHDIGEEFASGTGLAAEQLRFVIVRDCSQENVPGSEIKLCAIFLDSIIAKDTEGHVLVAAGLCLGSGSLAERDPFVHQSHAFGKGGL